jgi:ribokinase
MLLLRESDEILEEVDFIVAKSNELFIIFGEEKREEVLKKYFNKVFVRDDTNSTIYFDGTEMKYYRKNKEKTVYKMGMGDAFTAGFAIALCHGNSIEDCVKFGNEFHRVFLEIKVHRPACQECQILFLKAIYGISKVLN